jgi:chromate transport protein ChrA
MISCEVHALLAPSYKRWAKNPQLNAFVRGVTAAATGAIAGAVIVLARRSIYDAPTLAIALVSLAVLFRWRVPEPIVIGCAAMAGLLLRPAWPTNRPRLGRSPVPELLTRGGNFLNIRSAHTGRGAYR